MSALGQIILNLTTTLTLSTAPAPALDMVNVEDPNASLVTLSVGLGATSLAVGAPGIDAVTTVESLRDTWSLDAQGRLVPRRELGDALTAPRAIHAIDPLAD